MAKNNSSAKHAELMVSAGLLTYFGAILGLTIESTSPEAYCPPVSEVRQSVEARVGAVEGEAFEARYGLVRDTQTGRTFVLLVLVDSGEREVLRREIPVSEDGCSDAALAIAVVLERYFSGVVRTPSEEPGPLEESPPTEEGDPATEERPEEEPVAAAPPAVSPVVSGDGEASSTPSPQNAFVRGGLGLGGGSTPAFHLAFGRSLQEWGAVFTELSSWPIPRTVQSQSYESKSWFGALHVGIELKMGFSQRLEVGLAPHFGMALQGANVRAPQVASEGFQMRALPTVGTSFRIGYRVSDRWGVGAQVHGLALLGGKRFVVQEGDARRELLELPSGRGDASAYLSYAF